MPCRMYVCVCKGGGVERGTAMGVVCLLPSNQQPPPETHCAALCSISSTARSCAAWASCSAFSPAAFASLTLLSPSSSASLRAFSACTSCLRCISIVRIFCSVAARHCEMSSSRTSRARSAVSTRFARPSHRLFSAPSSDRRWEAASSASRAASAAADRWVASAVSAPSSTRAGPRRARTASEAGPEARCVPRWERKWGQGGEDRARHHI